VGGIRQSSTSQEWRFSLVAKSQALMTPKYLAGVAMKLASSASKPCTALKFWTFLVAAISFFIRIASVKFVNFHPPLSAGAD